ncbi:MAG: hypothetical protein KAR01_04155, partial [Desulfocapsa sp.]|nr:hypothetical protein [Desulfocapsa sp.]
EPEPTPEPSLSVKISEGVSVPGESSNVTISGDSPNIYTYSGDHVDSSGNLDLSAANSDTSTAFNPGNGLGVFTEGEKNIDGANTIDDQESVVIDFESDVDSANITIKHLKGETTTWTAYDSDGVAVESGTIEGPGHDADFSTEISPSGDFQYLVLSGNEGTKANGFYLVGIEGTEQASTEHSLDIEAQIPDVAENETLSINVTGLPDTTSLTDGIKNDDGSWTLTQDQLDDLKITVPGDSPDQFEIEVTATTSVGETTNQLTITASTGMDAADIDQVAEEQEPTHEVIDLEANLASIDLSATSEDLEQTDDTEEDAATQQEDSPQTEGSNTEPSDENT